MTQPPDRPVSPADQAAFDTLVQEAQPTIRAMVVAWRTGLTGLITLVTTGIVLTGRTNTAGLTVPWRIAVTVAIGGGLMLAILGLWQTLGAEVGTRARVRSLADIHRKHASVEAWKVHLAKEAAERLQTARTLVAVALGLLLTGVILTWWAPPAPTNPAAYMKVTSPDGDICGALISADDGVVRLSVAGAHNPAAIPLSKVTNLAITTSCP